MLTVVGQRVLAIEGQQVRYFRRGLVRELSPPLSVHWSLGLPTSLNVRPSSGSDAVVAQAVQIGFDPLLIDFTSGIQVLGALLSGHFARAKTNAFLND